MPPPMIATSLRLPPPQDASGSAASPAAAPIALSSARRPMPEWPGRGTGRPAACRCLRRARWSAWTTIGDPRIDVIPLLFARRPNTSPARTRWRGDARHRSAEVGAMAEFFDALTDEHVAMIAAQPVFFVATAAPGARINLSPKGYDCFRVLSPTRVAWLDLGGSGNETNAHLLADGRITLMFCNFQQP